MDSKTTETFKVSGKLPGKLAVPDTGSET